MTSRGTSWFRGYVAWYLRAVIWFAQSAVAGAVLLWALGTEGTVGAVGALATGLVSALLLFRQVDRHVRQEIGR